MKIGRVAYNTGISLTLCFILKANVNVADIEMAELHGWLSLKFKNKSHTLPFFNLKYHVGSYHIFEYYLVCECYKLLEGK